MLIVFVFAVFALAGLIKGVIGMGLPTVSVGLLSLVMSPAEAAAILLIPSTVTNVWQLWTGPHLGALVRRLWPMLMAVCLGTWGASFLGLGLLTSEMAGRASRRSGRRSYSMPRSGSRGFRCTRRRGWNGGSAP